MAKCVCLCRDASKHSLIETFGHLPTGGRKSFGGHTLIDAIPVFHFWIIIPARISLPSASFEHQLLFRKRPSVTLHSTSTFRAKLIPEMPRVRGPICSALWYGCSVQGLQMWLVRDYICVCEMKLPSQNQGRVFTRERDKTLKGFCVIKFNLWSFSGCISLLCIASCSPHSLCEMLLDALWPCLCVATYRGQLTFDFPFECISSHLELPSESYTYSRGVLVCIKLSLCVTSNQRCCSVARVTLCVCLAHPFSTDGTAKSHVVTLFLWCLPSLGSVTTSVNTKLVICVHFLIWFSQSCWLLCCYWEKY